MTRFPKVSIIMCAYNADKYLNQALQSVDNLLYPNVELIIINDGSTDATDFIINNYITTHENIIYRSQDNRGLAYSRNKGVILASGKYVTFLDADDLLYPDSISYLVQIAYERNADIVYGKLLLSKNYACVHQTSEQISIKECRDVSAVKEYFLDGAGNVTGGIFERKLFNQPLFPVGLIYEDNVAKLSLLLRASKVIFSDKWVYFYRNTHGSIIQSKTTKKNLDIITIGKQQRKLLKESGTVQFIRLDYLHYFFISRILFDILKRLKKSEEKVFYKELMKKMTVYLAKLILFGLLLRHKGFQ